MNNNVQTFVLNGVEFRKYFSSDKYISQKPEHKVYRFDKINEILVDWLTIDSVYFDDDNDHKNLQTVVNMLDDYKDGVLDLKLWFENYWIKTSIYDHSDYFSVHEIVHSLEKIKKIVNDYYNGFVVVVDDWTAFFNFNNEEEFKSLLTILDSIIDPVCEIATNIERQIDSEADLVF